jgi:hypothetical protein
MAKAKTTQTPAVATLTQAKAERIARIWIAGDAALAKAGGELATRIAQEASAVFERNATPGKPDADLVTKIVGKSRGWSAASLNVRSSEILAIMRARTGLPKGVAAIEKAFAGTCRWNDAVNAARAINDGKDPVRFVKGKRKGAGEEPKDAEAVKKSIAIAVKKWLEWSATPRALKTSLRQMCGEHRINIGKA